MKRLPMVVSFILFIALCVSLAFWAMQLLRPAARAVVAPPAVATELNLQAAAGLFGGRSTLATASNFQLKGVVAAHDGRDSVAILSANGKPAQAVRQGAEIAPGAVVKEVHRRYVLVSDGGVPQRVELPSTAPPSVLANPAAAGSAPAVRPNPVSSPPAPAPAPAATLGPATPIQTPPGAEVGANRTPGNAAVPPAAQ